MNVLELEPAVVSYQWADGNVTRHAEVHYLDFVVDGCSLAELLRASGRGDLVTPLARPWLRHVADEVGRLLGRRLTPGADPGRVHLLVCSVCGDSGCGAVSARVEVDEHRVVWSDWRWELVRGFESIAELSGPMRFERSSYERVLSAAEARLEVMPYDELAYRGRRFLRPWQWGWRLPLRR